MTPRASPVPRRLSHAEIAELAGVLSVGIAAVDERGRQVYVNEAFAAMVGWAAEELLGASPPFLYWPEEEREAISQALQATVSGASPASGYRLRFAHRDGSRFPVLVSVAPLERTVGDRLWVAAVTDLSGQSAAERAVAERDRRLELALEAGRLGSWEYDLASGKVVWSPGLERIHGLPEGGFGGTFEHYTRDIHPEDLERVLGTIGRSVAGEAPHELEYRIVRPDGEVRWLSARGELFRDQSGPARMIGICSDVTERREAEQAVREARDEAESANRAKAEFLAVMSHDLRTPLNAIAGYLDLLEEGIYGEVAKEQREAFARMRRNQKQLLRLINDLLHFAQLDAGKLTLEPGEWSVAEVLEGMGPMIEPVAASRGIEYARGNVDLDLRLRGDLERVQQILLNLLSNAVKFTPPGGRVELTAERNGETVALRVRDTGRGIEPDRLESIFDPFVQIERIRETPGEGGVGLGLAISRDLARAMGGDVEVESEPGRGSRFTVVLPRA